MEASRTAVQQRVPRRFGEFILFTLPLAHVGTIFGVAVHEILGHGVAAELVGGRIEGFTLKWDGMGTASTTLPRDVEPWQDAFYLLAGGLSTVLVGSGLLIASQYVRNLWARTALIVVSTATLLDSPTYTFWSALHPGTRGDAARIVTQFESSQPALVAGGLILTVAATLLAFGLLLRCVESHVGGATSFVGRTRLVAVAVVFVLPCSAFYYLFDWNQLIPGIGRTPSHVNLALCSVLAVVLFRWLPGRPLPVTDEALPARALVCAWIACAAVVVLTEAWFSGGVQFR